MSTHSNIGILDANGKVRGVYCQYDGYPSHMGKMLREHYNSLEKAEALIALGDLRSIEKTLEETTAYHRDVGEDWEDVKGTTWPTLEDFINNEYNYVFDKNVGEWRGFRSDEDEFEIYPYLRVRMRAGEKLSEENIDPCDEEFD